MCSVRFNGKIHIKVVKISFLASILANSWLCLKGGVSDFWKPMLTFEITKTNTPLPQKGLAPILIAPPHTYVRQWLVLWNKAKPMLLTFSRRNKATSVSDRRPSAPWVLYSAGKLIQYLHGSFLPYRNTVSTLDASGATKYYRTHYNQWCGLHWMLHGQALSLLLFRRRLPLLFFIRHLKKCISHL